MAYQNKHDKSGLNSSDGDLAEQAFRELAVEKGYMVVEATKEMQFAHVDFLLEKDGKFWKIDCKAKKKLDRSSKNYTDEFCWIEFVNVQGNPGWLYGKADYIAFQREYGFMLVSRKELSELCDRVVDFTTVASKAKFAYKKVYRRFKRKDKIAYLKFSEIEEVSHTNWYLDSNASVTSSM